MNIYEKPNFTLTEIYEDIIRTSLEEEEEELKGLVDGGSGEGEGTQYGQWGF